MMLMVIFLMAVMVHDGACHDDGGDGGKHGPKSRNQHPPQQHRHAMEEIASERGERAKFGLCAAHRHPIIHGEINPRLRPGCAARAPPTLQIATS